MISLLSLDGDLLDRPPLSPRRSGLLDREKDLVDDNERDLALEVERRDAGRLRRGDGEREGLREIEAKEDLL